MIEIEQRLKEHRRRIGYLKILKLKKEKIQKELKKIPDQVKYCNTTSLLKFEPPNYKVNRTVEDAGIKSAKIHKDLQAGLNVIEIKIEELEPEIEAIEALVQSLSDTEREVIQKFFIYGWRKCEVLNNLHLSERTLATIKKMALKKMADLLK